MQNQNKNENENLKYIAIHIGNDYSYVALWENNKIKIIPFSNYFNYAKSK